MIDQPRHDAVLRQNESRASQKSAFRPVPIAIGAIGALSLVGGALYSGSRAEAKARAEGLQDFQQQTADHQMLTLQELEATAGDLLGKQVSTRLVLDEIVSKNFTVMMRGVEQQLTRELLALQIQSMDSPKSSVDFILSPAAKGLGLAYAESLREGGLRDCPLRVAGTVLPGTTEDGYTLWIELVLPE